MKKNFFYSCVLIITLLIIPFLSTTSFATEITDAHKSEPKGKYQLVVEANVDPRITGDIVVTIKNTTGKESHTTTLYKHNGYSNFIEVSELGTYSVALCEIPNNWDFRYKVEYASVTINPEITNYLFFDVGDPNFDEVLDSKIDSDGDGWADDVSHGVFENDNSATSNNGSQNFIEGDIINGGFADGAKTFSAVLLISFFALLAAIIGISFFIYRKNNSNV
jgi:hypothetical protein